MPIFFTEIKGFLRNMEHATINVLHVGPVCCLTDELLLIRDRFVAPVGRILHHAVICRHVVLGLPLLPAAPAELLEGSAKLLRHEVVDDGVDGAVGVDAHATEEEEPGVVVSWVHEAVDDHHRSVRHPQQGEEDDHHSQHLGYLLEQRRRRRTLKGALLFCQGCNYWRLRDLL